MAKPGSGAQITLNFTVNDVTPNYNIGSVVISIDEFKLSAVHAIAGKAAVAALKNAMALTDDGTLTGGSWD